jgi:hypothetical protein
LEDEKNNYGYKAPEMLENGKNPPKNKMMKLRKTFLKKTSSHLLVDCWFAEYCRYMNCICQNYNVFYCIMYIFFFTTADPYGRLCQAFSPQLRAWEAETLWEYAWLGSLSERSKYRP